MDNTLVFVVYMIEGTYMFRVYVRVDPDNAPNGIAEEYNETSNRRWLRKQIPDHITGKIAYVEFDHGADVVDVPTQNRVKELERLRAKVEHGCTDAWCLHCDGQKMGE